MNHQTDNDVLQFLNQYADQKSSLPPVELWDPDFCGEMNMQLTADGRWIHDGSPIERKKMIVLFSKIIKKIEQQYYLVTPVEKIAIQVEWQPFVIVDFEKVEVSNKLCYLFIDNCDNKVLLTKLEQLDFSTYRDESLPIINVRRNLYASFSRSCYYRLIEQAKLIEGEHQQSVQVKSNGLNFSLGFIAKEK